MALGIFFCMGFYDYNCNDYGSILQEKKVAMTVTAMNVAPTTSSCIEIAGDCEKIRNKKYSLS